MLYTIKPGDTISDLARKFNVPESRIAEAAKVTDGGPLQPGLMIRLADELLIQTQATSTTPNPSDGAGLHSTVARAQAAQTTSRWSDTYGVPATPPPAPAGQPPLAPAAGIPAPGGTAPGVGAGQVLGVATPVQAGGSAAPAAAAPEAPASAPKPEAQSTIERWSDEIEVPYGWAWEGANAPDTSAPGSVYKPVTNEAAGEAAPKKSWFDKLIDGVEDKVDAVAKSIEKATGNNPLVKLFTGFGRFQVQIAGGALKAVGDMVGGVVSAVTHPIQTLKGLWGLAAHIPFSPPNLIHVGMQALQGKSFSEILDEEKRYMKGVWDGLTGGYQTAIKEGKWGEIPGRLLVDVGSLLIGAGEANAAAKGVSTAGKVAAGAEVAAKTANVAAKASRFQKAVTAATTAIKGSRVAGVATRAAAVSQKVLDLLGDVGRAALAAAKSNKLGAAAVAQAERLGARVVAIAEKAKTLQGVEKAGQLYAKLADEAAVVAREARALGATVKDASMAQIALELESRAGQMRLAATAASAGIPLNGLEGGVTAFGDR